MYVCWRARWLNGWLAAWRVTILSMPMFVLPLQLQSQYIVDATKPRSETKTLFSGELPLCCCTRFCFFVLPFFHYISIKNTFSESSKRHRKTPPNQFGEPPSFAVERPPPTTIQKRPTWRWVCSLVVHHLIGESVGWDREAENYNNNYNKQI